MCFSHGDIPTPSTFISTKEESPAVAEAVYSHSYYGISHEEGDRDVARTNKTLTGYCPLTAHSVYHL